MKAVRKAAVNSVDPDGIPRIVSREEWNARPPQSIVLIKLPVPSVVIHHSHNMASCSCLKACVCSMKTIQDFHMDGKKWSDIAYNFLIGGDGTIFEGRGWTRVGSHAGPSYNDIGLGMCLIGDFSSFLPLKAQLNATKSLIKYGVDQGFIAPNYLLYGHRDVRNTECPGEALYTEIKKWPHKARAQ